MSLFLLLQITGCAEIENRERNVTTNLEVVEDVKTNGIENTNETQQNTSNEINDESMPTLLYMGQASIRIVTADGKVIYIDPWSGDEYNLPADLILVTHDHYDHSDIDKVTERNGDCQIITAKEAVIDGEHRVFDLGYVKIEAVEAGYNDWHDVNQCVGYILTFENGKSVYVTGDTSTTEQMADLSEKKI